MVEKLTPKQFWQIFKNLPQDIREHLFSEELVENVYQVCKRYKLEENFDEILEEIGNVLSGFLHPDDFNSLISQKINLSEEEKRRFLHEIYRFAFFPVKESLNEIYTLGAPKFKKEALSKEKLELEKEKREIYQFLEEEKKEEKVEIPKKPVDIYREPIE